MTTQTLQNGIIVLATVMILSACAGPEERSEGQAAFSGPVSVASLLTVEEFRAAGLDRLSEEEIAALNQALGRALAAGDEGPRADEGPMAAWEVSESNPFATFGMGDEHPASRAQDEMPAKLAEAIPRWQSDTRIFLENGQIWQVAGTVRSGLPSAEAGDRLIISRGAFGSFRLSLEGSNRTVSVRRKE
ncbi:hypothetical protein J2T60_002385 [Natronospira proteinivora]|uniref:Uncharacterized protein n=1 Tax=Natronospira proteinivora TaxID=1807133 RepID=A0ABT1GAP3_9GAMM|nr:hypothetical protein [Natronospira proteinivora]MCP1728385.1 hypothetical protein [Natronospira proteinivora]